jgi:hypothetical protein
VLHGTQVFSLIKCEESHARMQPNDLILDNTVTFRLVYYRTNMAPPQLILFREIIAVHCDNRLKYTNTLLRQSAACSAVQLEVQT